MAGNKQNAAKKPFWKKWWFWVIIIALAFIGGKGGTINTSTNPVTTNTQSTATAPQPESTTKQSEPTTKPNESATESKKEEESPSAQFAAAFSSAYGTPISDITAFDPQDRDGGHYRVEFRLGAYKDSIGKHGTIGDMSIDMIEYGGKHKDFRIYLTGPKESVIAAYPALAKAMDPSLSDADIQSILGKFSNEGTPINDGLSFVDSNKRIRNDSLTNGSDETAEAYIDADFRK
ncbi:hypothetical protein KIH79_10655 [Bifidobacterium sp. 82T10]|uniref:Uncharacterized protein n=1 Tax=Bifidobacterium miconis TaxID=2834435 RepID=A0ABS6WHZ2_9BIFI|nr:hypothetical protein [Bifidobacterium miconis]MBW3093370.1 hypothetical protein [Bifidobacterium miconis]